MQITQAFDLSLLQSHPILYPDGNGFGSFKKTLINLPGMDFEYSDSL